MNNKCFVQKQSLLCWLLQRDHFSQITILVLSKFVLKWHFSAKEFCSTIFSGIVNRLLYQILELHYKKVYAIKCPWCLNTTDSFVCKIYLLHEAARCGRKKMVYIWKKQHCFKPVWLSKEFSHILECRTLHKPQSPCQNYEQ